MNWTNIYKDHLTGEEVERLANEHEMIEFQETQQETPTE